MTQTKFSISAAARIVNRNRATLSRHIKDGKLSYELDSQGRKVLDAGELVRVYGADFQLAENEIEANIKPTNNQIMQDRLIAQYEDRIEHLEKTNSHLQNTLEKALDIPPLLEDRSVKEDAWQASLEATITKVTEQTESQISALKQDYDQERDKRQKEILVLKRALRKERERTFWQRLLSK